MNQQEQMVRVTATKVLLEEAAAIAKLTDQIDDKFIEACHKILDCSGRVIVTGIGKSGHICRKIAATFASTGTPAFFVHAAEAGHGDAGLITPHDLVIAISNSGTAQEIQSLFPILEHNKVFLIALTSSPESILAKQANIHINLGVRREACHLGLAPTASTAAAMAMGDALAIAVSNMKGFTRDDFGRSHPAGALGAKVNG